MKKQARNKPIPFLYGLFRGIGAGFLRFFCGYRRAGEHIPKQGPLLVVASHQGMLDFLTVAEALPGRRVQFIVTRRYFRNPLMRFFFRIDGAVPKTQFHPDPAGIAAMLRILKRGGTVALFPAGQTSVCGLPETISPAVARLAKRAGAPVCAVRQHGGFYTMPRLRPNRPCFGKIEAETRVILTPEQLKTLPEEEIYRIICDAIHFDEDAWQQRTGALFRGEHRAEGLERALWLCPRCGAEFALSGRGNELSCKRCNNIVRIGMDMRFSSVTGDGFIPSTVSEWYLWQEERLKQELADPEFALEASAEAFSWEGGRYISRGTGTLRLDAALISYSGGWDGETVTLSLRHETLPGLTTEIGGVLEIHNEKYGLVRCRLNNAGALPKWKQAQEYLHRRLTGEQG